MFFGSFFKRSINFIIIIIFVVVVVVVVVDYLRKEPATKRVATKKKSFHITVEEMITYKNKIKWSCKQKKKFFFFRAILVSQIYMYKEKGVNSNYSADDDDDDNNNCYDFDLDTLLRVNDFECTPYASHQSSEFFWSVHLSICC